VVFPIFDGVGFRPVLVRGLADTPLPLTAHVLLRPCLQVHLIADKSISLDTCSRAEKTAFAKIGTAESPGRLPITSKTALERVFTIELE
jgi:hypothetical protein